LFLPRRRALNRWLISVGDHTTEGGSNTGSDFSISRYDDSGNGIDYPLSIKRQTGQVTFTQPIIVPNVPPVAKATARPIGDALDKVLALNGVTFRGRLGQDIGLIPEDVEPVVPEVIQHYQDNDGEPNTAVNYPHLVPLLIEAVKTLTARLEALETMAQPAPSRPARRR
jgi:hypothetical protein